MLGAFHFRLPDEELLTFSKRPMRGSAEEEIRESWLVGAFRSKEKRSSVALHLLYPLFGFLYSLAAEKNDFFTTSSQRISEVGMHEQPDLVDL